MKAGSNDIPARRFDIARIREDFPILKRKVHGKPLVYFDNGATSQKPQAVIDALARYYSAENSNIHRGVHWLSERATVRFEDVRARVARFLGAASATEIVFTSGTTGEPKGAMITHGSLLACVTSMMGVFPIGPSERLLSVLPLSHLYEQVIGFLCPLYGGAAVVYPVSRQPGVLLRSFRDFKITTLLLVPQGLRLLEGAIERRAAQKGQAKLLERLHRIARPLPRPLRRLIFTPVLAQLGGKLKTIGVGFGEDLLKTVA